MKKQDSKWMTIEVAVKTETQSKWEDKGAILVIQNEEEIWIPKSQIEFEAWPLNLVPGELTQIVITIPAWLFHAKGLLP